MYMVIYGSCITLNEFHVIYGSCITLNESHVISVMLLANGFSTIEFELCGNSCIVVTGHCVGDPGPRTLAILGFPFQLELDETPGR